MTEENLKKANLQKIAEKGAAIYEKIKAEQELSNVGKFLAIDTTNEKVYLADTSAEAVVKARTEHPNQIFYVKKIGFDAAETMASLAKND